MKTSTDEEQRMLAELEYELSKYSLEQLTEEVERRKQPRQSHYGHNISLLDMPYWCSDCNVPVDL